MKSHVTLAALALIVAVQVAAGDFVAPPNGRNPLKRSLCNTFGGCGAKRSIMPHLAGNFRLSNEDNEQRHLGANAKLVSQILDDIVDHLQQDQRYKQRARFPVYAPERADDGAAASNLGSLVNSGNSGNRFPQQADADKMAALMQRVTPSFRDEDELGRLL